MESWGEAVAPLSAAGHLESHRRRSPHDLGQTLLPSHRSPSCGCCQNLREEKRDLSGGENLGDVMGARERERQEREEDEGNEGSVGGFLTYISWC